MTKIEFMTELKSALAGEVPAEVMLDSYRYYENYFDEESRIGKTEEEILEQLGKPTLIARSIIAANKQQRDADLEYTEDGKIRKVKQNEKSEQEEEQKKSTLHSILIKLLLLFVGAGIIVLVFFLLQGVFWLILNIGLPILLVIGCVYLIKYFVKK